MSRSMGKVKWPMSPRVIYPTKADIERGRRMGLWLHQRRDASAMRYRPKKDVIELDMVSGLRITIPRKLIPWFADLDRSTMRKARLMRFGDAIEIEVLDLHVGISSALLAILGFDHSQRGGMATTLAKIRAARLNGRKGGRPKKRLSFTSQKLG